MKEWFPQVRSGVEMAIEQMGARRDGRRRKTQAR